MHILLIDDDISILELYSIVLESTFSGCKLVKSISPKTAIAELTKEKFDLIVCDYDMPPDGTGKEVYNYVIQNNLESKFSFLTSRSINELDFYQGSLKDSNQFDYLQKPCSPKELKKHLKEFMNVKEEKLKEYYPIRIFYFLRSNISMCPIFIKLGDDKFVRMINEKEEYEHSHIEKYINRNIQNLYIHKKDYEDFLVHLGNYSFLKEENSQIQDTFTISKKTHNYLNAMVRTIGISNYAVSIAEKTTEVILTELSQHRRLNDLLTSVLNGTDYTYDHSYLITCICAQICQEMNLSKEVIGKLGMASLLHDVALESGQIAYLHDIAPLEIEKLSLNQKKNIESHVDIMDGLDEVNDLTLDVTNIIKTHHTGVSEYPYQGNKDLSGLNYLQSIFVVAHAISNELYKVNFESSRIRDCITVVKINYSSNNFSKIHRAIEQIFLKNQGF